MSFLLEKKASTSISRSGIVSQTKVIERARSVGSIGGKDYKIILTFSATGLYISSHNLFKKYIFEKIQHQIYLQRKLIYLFLAEFYLKITFPIF